MQIDKIRMRKDGGVNLKWKTRNEADTDWIEHALNCPEEATLEFDETLQHLTEYVCEINEESVVSAEKMTVTGITIRWKDNTRKIVITAKMPVEMSNSPKNIVTPIVPLDSEAVDEDHVEFIGKLAHLVDDICEKSKDYINGERRQERMNFDTAQESEEAA